MTIPDAGLGGAIPAPTVTATPLLHRPDAHPSRESRYRPDLDGLRAVAVLPVVLFHFGIARLSGGFVGVDIFFVLSGFFITSILARDLDAESFSLGRFYERRARRILPALFAVLAVTSAMALGMFLPADLLDYSKSLVATLGFGSNVYFTLRSGYFDTAAALQPLLHTWSLAVEEQFYLFYPLALWLVSTPVLRRWRLRLVCSALALSFLISVAFTPRHATPAFYLPPTRAWELFLGGIVALRMDAIRTNRRLANVLSIIGLVLIGAGITLIDESMPFPGWVAAVPCVGTTLVIWASVAGGGLGNSMLTWRPLVYIGKLSYSLYLWHWPLIVAFRYRLGREPTVAETLALTVVAIGLSAASWKYVEAPFRRGSGVSRARLWTFAATGAAVLVAVAASSIAAHGFPARFSPSVLRLVTVEAPIFPECFGVTAEAIHADRTCTIGASQPAPLQFVVWGDSHADRIALPISKLAIQRGVRGYAYTTGSCPPLLGVDWPAIGCRRFNDEVFAAIARNHVRHVFIHAAWAAYSDGIAYAHVGTHRFAHDSLSAPRSLAEGRRLFERALVGTVDRLIARGVRVTLVGPVPEIGFDVPRALARASRFGTADPQGPTMREFNARQQAVLPALRRTALIAGVDVIYPSTALCTTFCTIARGDRPLYIDDNHLSAVGTQLLEPALATAFRDGSSALTVPTRNPDQPEHREGPSFDFIRVHPHAASPSAAGDSSLSAEPPLHIRKSRSDGSGF